MLQLTLFVSVCLDPFRGRSETVSSRLNVFFFCLGFLPFLFRGLTFPALRHAIITARVCRCVSLWVVSVCVCVRFSVGVRGCRVHACGAARGCQ